jgi:hypothetical protein
VCSSIHPHDKKESLISNISLWMAFPIEKIEIFFFDHRRGISQANAKCPMDTLLIHKGETI